MDKNQAQTKEKQYSILYDVSKRCGVSKFGIMANESWNNDPKRTLFTLARYKFVSKMLSNKKLILEVGCADGFGTRIVKQHVDKLDAIDFDDLFIENAIKTNSDEWPITFFSHNILDAPINNNYDGIYALDVLEHIDKNDEETFIRNCIQSMNNNGILIIGMPSLESQKYASPQSKAGHVNCKSGNEFRETMENYFSNCFLFSMNDEVVHTGYNKMAHYLIAVCTCPK